MNRRLLLVNPNSSAAVTARMERVARGLLAPHERLDAVTAVGGPEYLGDPDALQAGERAAIDCACRAARSCPHAYAGVIVGCFADIAVEAIESRLGVPAATLLSASLAVALRHGTRIGIVTAGAAWEALLPPMAGALLGGAPAARVVSVRTFAATPDRIERDEPWALEQVEGLVRCCVRRDGADVVVVGGAGLSGLGLALTSGATPVVDSLAAAVLAARADVIALSRGCP